MERARKGKASRRFQVFIALMVLGTLGGAFFYFKSAKQDSNQFPLLPIVDLNDQRQAGTIVRLSGNTYTRTASPEDMQRPEIAAPPDGKASDWTLVSANTPYFVGTLFHARPGAHLEVMTSGNYLTGVDGEGEFILEDARHSEDGVVRTITWLVKKGMLRIKPHDSDKSDHWTVVKTQTCRVIVRQGELGIRVNEGGVAGQVWLMSGQARVFWKDGREQELKVREMIRL